MLPAMPDVRAIFFDMDDTLVDDTGCYQRSIEGVCADLGPPFDAVTLQAAYGAVSTTWWPSGDLMTLRKRLWRQALEACGYDVAHAPRVVERYLHHRVQTVTLLDGVVELLEALQSKYRLGVITNGGGDIQRLRLAHLGLDQYFDAIVASTDVDAGKPDRRIFDHASKLLGVPASETWHVGDSLVSDVTGGAECQSAGSSLVQLPPR